MHLNENKQNLPKLALTKPLNCFSFDLVLVINIVSLFPNLYKGT